MALAYWLLLADLITMAVLPADLLHWEMSAINVDLSDFLLASTVLLLFAGSERPSWRTLTRIPFITLWVAYGVLRSIAYLNAPKVGIYDTSLQATAYQLYRYCWKPLLYYPIAAVLVRGRSRRESTILALVLAADVTAVQGIVQGYAGMLSTAFFKTKNQFGGFLIIPLILSLFRTLIPWPSPKARLRRAFFGLSLVMLVRTLVFTGSRGAFVATTFGSACLFAGLYFESSQRQRVKRALVVAAVATVGLFVVKPDLLERPRVAFMLTASNPTEVDNFQWREERWQHFMDRVWEHPWLGVWSDNDFELGDFTNTPHNGYLSVAAISGIPSLLLFAVLSLCALNRARVTAQHGENSVDRSFVVAVAACILGVLLHNTSESTVTLPFVGAPLWVLLAWAAVSPPRRGASVSVARRPAQWRGVSANQPHAARSVLSP